MGDGSDVSESLLENFIPGEELESESTTTLQKASDNIQGNANATFVRRFGNKGQNISIWGGISKNETKAKITSPHLQNTIQQDSLMSWINYNTRCLIILPGMLRLLTRNR